MSSAPLAPLPAASCISCISCISCSSYGSLISLLWRCCLWLALLLALPAQAQLTLQQRAADQVVTPYVQAQLVVQAPQGIAAGQPLMLGLLLTHQPQWHTYWKNAGDSGQPTQLDWDVPPGLEMGEIAWPVPQQIRVGDLLNYGYEGQILLPVPVTVGPDFAANADGMVRIGLHASWLACRVECIPQNAQLQVQVAAAQSHAAFASAFATAQSRQPQTSGALAGQFEVAPDGEHMSLQVQGLPPQAQGQELAFYPEAADTFSHAAVSGRGWQQRWEGAVWHATLALSDMRGATPAALDIVLGLPVAGSSVAEQPPEQAWRISAPVQGQWQPAQLPEISPALAAALAINQANQANEANQNSATPPASHKADSNSWWVAVAGGLIGGLLLNLMPCVFPVLAIKLLGFAHHASDVRAQRLGGLAYTLGTVMSFAALGVLLLLLRAAGEQLGWGFQLQNPLVIAVLAVLFTVLGLNLAGVFEFGQMLPGGVAALHLRHPVADALLSGVLAVAVASPCTAPFMGASLGFAVALPPVQAVGIFAALGLGMALPYLLLSWVPGLLRWLPRPGPWMATFRSAMAFPMLATVVWLTWVLGQQSGVDGVAALLALLLALSALIWALTLQGRTRWLLGAVLAALLIWLLPTLTPYLRELPPQEAAVASSSAPGAALWQPWSPEQQAQWLAEGHPVFVDYTAAWCVTCQFNKRTTLSAPEVLQAFTLRGVKLLRADWTRQDRRITTALEQLGRSGVPVYVLLAPGKEPVVLTELIRPDDVLQALAGI